METKAAGLQCTPKFYRFDFDVSLKYRNRKTDDDFDTEFFYGPEQVDNFNILAIEELGSDLSTCWLSVNRKVSPTTVINIASQMFTVIKNLHDNNIIHRDIKPTNFMMGIGKSSK